MNFLKQLFCRHRYAKTGIFVLEGTKCVVMTTEKCSKCGKEIMVFKPKAIKRLAR